MGVISHVGSTPTHGTSSLMLATELKTGTIYKESGAPLLVMKYAHTKVARGGATVKVKVRNLLTDSVLERNYKASDSVDQADVMRKNAQYIYEDNGYVFMDPDTYEQFTMTGDVIGEAAQYLTEGMKVQVMYFEGNPVSIELPIKATFTVSYTEPGYKGNTVSSVFKDAELDNGAHAKVPSFIKIGDKIIVDTRTGEYISKA